MYASGNLGRVYALNAVTGEELWTFTPEMNMQVARSACCDWANRGLAVSQGKVIVAALDGTRHPDVVRPHRYAGQNHQRRLV